MPSKHLLVSSSVHILKCTAPAIQAETSQYLCSRAATPRPAAGTRATAVGKAMARSGEQGATAHSFFHYKKLKVTGPVKPKKGGGFFHTMCNYTVELLVVVKFTGVQS